MNPTSRAPHSIPKRYIGTYLAKPVTGSLYRPPIWNHFMNIRMGPTTIGRLPHFLDEFYKVHVGNGNYLDPKFAILTQVLRECNQITQNVFWYLEQRSVNDNMPDKIFFLNQALLRNHELWNKVADALTKCIRKSPEVIYLFMLGRKSNPFDPQHSGAAKVFLQNLVKRTIRDPRSWRNLFRRSFLVDEVREYILTTNMLSRDVEDEIEGRTETEPELNQEARA